MDQLSMKKPLLAVFVKHYLTPEGTNYFKNKWFPLAETIISKQKGFISIGYSLDRDCVNIALKFENEALLQDGISFPCHDELIDLLDPFRSRVYWEAASTENEDADLSRLEWEIYSPRELHETTHQLNPTEKIVGAFLDSRRLANPGPPLEERTIHDLRMGVKSFLQYAGNAEKISFTDKKVPARDGFEISIRIYNEDLPENSPVLIFYPGSAFVFDLFEVNGIICSRIANAAPIKVILVQFRLSPEYPMPISIYDSYDAALYIATHAQSFGIDPARIFLGGWCSGAHAATVVSNLARQKDELKIYHQILLSGSYDLLEGNHDFDDYEKEDKTLNRKFLAHIAAKYYGISPEDYRNPLLSPYYESNFKGFPATTILVGEYDALRNDSEGYFQILQKAGVPAEKIILKGQTHNTVAMRKVLSEDPDPAEVIAKVIKSKLHLE